VFQLSVTIDIPGEEPYRLQPRLFGKVKFFLGWNSIWLILMLSEFPDLCWRILEWKGFLSFGENGLEKMDKSQ